MKRNSWVLLVFFLLCTTQTIDSQAQKNHEKVILEWTNNLIYKIDDDLTLEYLNFEGAISDFKYGELPVFFQKSAVDNFFSDCQVTLFNERYEILSAENRKLVPEQLLKAQLEPQVKCYAERKKPYAILTLLPFIKDASGDIKKLVSFEYTLTPNYLLTKSTHSYVEQSVLASGQWYKVKVSESGLYKLTFEDLVTMGFSGSSISSSLLGVFGNGTGRLPETNGEYRPDDLLELPIWVNDGGDGSFDPTDYLVFYAKSPHSVAFNPYSQTFTHNYNIYDDNNYYFITISGAGQHKRIVEVEMPQQGYTNTISDFIDYKFHEVDEINLEQTGQEWFSDLFDVTLQRSYTLSFSNIKSASAKLTLSAASHATSSSSFAISVNGNSVGSLSLPAMSTAVARIATNSYNFTPSQSSLEISLDFHRNSSSTKGYLDYIAVQALCELSMHDGQFNFNNGQFALSNSTNRYMISNASPLMRIWDVTDPSHTVQMASTFSGSTCQFLSSDTAFKQFVAFDGTSYKTPTLVGHEANQNLHGESMADLIIVTHPDFRTQAEELANYRREHQHLSVKVVTVQQVYNEFSSGSLDPVAIRDYMKMIYEKSSGLYPKYLLLFGRPSYDYRGRVSGTSLFVPNYQRPANGNITEGTFRANDDFFGILDDGEGTLSHGMLDIAVGRFPASTTAQANLAVQKSINYSKEYDIVGQRSNKISNLADWRNIICFVADDGDGNEHLNTAEQCSNIVQSENKTINLDKIYCDAYPQVSNSGGQRFPEVTTAINDRMDRGSLFFTYVGHSGKDGLAHERIIEFSDINKWSNSYNQPVMMTLSCDFSWYDRPSVSPGEACYFNTDGGASALLTTSRVAYGGSNASYAKKAFASLFTPVEGHPRTIGEINMKAKNDYGGNNDAISMFIVLGDPSMPLAQPQYKVVTDSINGQAAGAVTDSLKALSEVIVKGRITDEEGHTLTDFNGNIFTTMFDKKEIKRTLANDPEESQAQDFEVQKSVLYRGNNTIKNGKFELKFIIPKDINYSYGNGKFSYYARSNQADAAGYFNQFVIGGNSNHTYTDEEGPQIELYLNDEHFVNKGITNADPVLYVKLRDELGINTTGNGIGHDLVAILDGANDAQIILNDYYEAVQDSSNQGTVKYQLRDLSKGSHKLKIRAWDILNNVSEKELEFVVANEEGLVLDHVLNYPNPFTTNTAFYFEHNHPGENLDILIQIFTISGKLIKTISTSQFLEGTRSEPIYWNGRDDFGDKIGKGTYIYKIKVRTSEGKMAEKIEKVVLL